MSTGQGSTAEAEKVKPHPRTLSWFGTAAVAMGGSNQSLFLVGALLIGQGNIPGQGSAAVLLLIAGVLISWMAAFGWTELVLMYPNRVGGIAACCAEAFRPYSPVLSNLTGVCYWWGWVPACGLTALMAAAIVQQWYLPWISVPGLATAIVLTLTLVNLLGIHFTTRVAIGIASVAASLAFVSAIVPIVTGHVNWSQATTFHLTIPFAGTFGAITSVMAGLYIIGFAAPAFEQATCHVGETINPNKNVPRAVFAAASMAGLYFIVLPLVWLGTIGHDSLSKDLAQEFQPLFSPLFGSLAKAIAIWFMVFNLLHVTLAALAGATRTLSQLADDGLLPEMLNKRAPSDAPWVSTLLLAGVAILFLWMGDPLWLIAAANLSYLIGISLPNVAVWLLRRNQPELTRPYRAPRGTVILGLIAAMMWGIATILGFEQFGLPTVIAGVVFAYAGSALYVWRKFSDRRKNGLPGITNTLHIKLTGAMLLVLVLDGAGYLLAVQNVPGVHKELIVALEDIFVVVALLTISVGLVLPGMIAHAAVQISNAAKRLTQGTLTDFSRAMKSLGVGDLDKAYANINIVPVQVHSHDEIGEMADSFNLMQQEVKNAAVDLGGAREGLRKARNTLTELNATLEQRVKERTQALEKEVIERKQIEEDLKAAHQRLLTAARQAGMAEVSTSVLHNVGNVLNTVNISSNVITEKLNQQALAGFGKLAELMDKPIDDLIIFIKNDPKGQQLPLYFTKLVGFWDMERKIIINELELLTKNISHIKDIISAQQVLSGVTGLQEVTSLANLFEDAILIALTENDRKRLTIQREFKELDEVLIDKSKTMQILINLLSNAKDSLFHSPKQDMALTLRMTSDNGNIRIEVVDNGHGIEPENLTRIFSYGFTTKKNGHGFGLHTCALSAKEMGGSLQVKSAGVGKGASFILELPFKPAISNKEIK